VLLSDIVAYKARGMPDQPALVFGGRSTTYAQLLERIHRVANAFGAVVERGDRVAILAENCPEYVECYYGIPKAGIALTLINYRLHPREMAWILQNSGARVLIVEPPYLDAIKGVRADIPGVERFVVIGDDYENMVQAAPSSEPDVGTEDTDLAWLLYTSGTTGLPKGAMLTHRNLVTAVANSCIAWSTAEMTAVFPFPLYHVAGYVVPIIHMVGGTLVLMRAYDPVGLLREVQDNRATDITGAPTMLNMLVQHPDFDRYDVSSVRRIGYGAAPMPAEVVRAVMAKFPAAEFQTGFGMTELGGNVMYFSDADHKRALVANPQLLTSVGKPMPLSTIRVVDDQLCDVGPNEIGELVIQGDQVTSGYWQNPEATKEAFAGGWFHSGDLAKLDEDGYLYIVDRKKDMIISGGENVYSREVEEVIYEHPAVAEVAVIGLPDMTWGENVTAVVTLRKGMEASEEELIEFCRARLASYKKPKAVFFVDELPKNPSGKILKRELRARYAG
jgi:acyl-CoA synthetase (AMP-forming)/AMP-acid ligase II